MEIVLEAGLAGARAGSQCVACLVNGEMGHGTSDFFRFRDGRDEWRKGTCPLFFRPFGNWRWTLLSFAAE